VALYGSSAAVKDLLNPSGGDDFTEGQESRIQQLLKVASALIEYRTSAVFGSSEPETIDVTADGGRRLYLPKGLRSLSTIIEGPDWLNGAWANGYALGTSAWRLDSQVSGGAYRTLYRMDGGWHGTYLITGVWEDQHATVPDEIHYLASYLAAEIFKKQAASPAGFVGPDNAVVPVRNTLNEPEVRDILSRYSVGPAIWVVS
jgi:hypothetical protein